MESKKQGWIALSEEQPPQGKKVAVGHIDKDGFCGTWYEAYWDRGVFIDGHGGSFPGATHWLDVPLPELKEA